MSNPTLTTFISPVMTGVEDTTIVINFEDLLAQGDEADDDGEVTAFVIKNFYNSHLGTLKVGVDFASATDWNWNYPWSTVIDSSHHAYWTPPANFNGTLNGFTVVARDNSGLESAMPVPVSVTFVDQINISVSAVSNPQEGNVGNFSITLDRPAPLGGLRVNYQLSGTAILGEDYTIDYNNAENIYNINATGFTIVGGATSAVFNVNALTDTVIDNNETVLLTLIDGVNYDLDITPQVDYDIVAGNEWNNNQRFKTGDFNNDGKLDVVSAVVNDVYDTNGILTYSENLSLLMRNASNTGFNRVDYEVGSMSQFPHNSPSIYANVGDFNGDNRLDLVVFTFDQFGYSNGISVRLRNANNTGFTSATNYEIWGASAVCTGDFNADGKMDLAAVTYYGSFSVLLRNANNTDFDKVDYSYNLGGTVSQIDTGDFNADGKLDLATWRDGGVSVLLRNTDNTDFIYENTYNTDYYYFSACTGDFNGDGKLDLARNSYGGSIQILLRNASNDGFDYEYINGVDPVNVRISSGDFNNDGKTDLALLKQNGINTGGGDYSISNVSILLRNESNTGFDVTRIDTPTNFNGRAVQTGDFNGDGKLELAIVNGNKVSLFGNASSYFSTLTLVEAQSNNTPPTGNVSITGMPTQNQVLTANNDLVDADGLGAISYTWQSSINNLTWTTLSTGANLTLTAAQVGKYIRVQASYTDGGNTFEQVASMATPIISSATMPLFTENEDRYNGLVAAESLNALAGDDVVYARSGNDTVIGNSGDDSLYGESGRDVLYAGTDTVFDEEDGNNKLYGGSGNDTLYSGFDDDLNGGGGIDTASYALATKAVQVNLRLSGEQETGGAGFDSLKSIENLIGGSAGDTLTGNNKANVLTGGKGNDTLNGGLGNDTVVFTGNFADYQFSRNSGSLIVTDNTVNRDGVDLLNANIETVQFADQSMLADELGLTLTRTNNITDFNGTGKSDLVLSHSDGSVRAITLNGLTSSTDAVIYNSAWQVINSKGDYNGDGKTDLMLWNNATSTAKIAFMNGAAISSESTLTDIANLTGWTIADSTADYNNDGNSDVLWWNASSHSVSVYLHDGGSVLASAQLFADTGAGWEIQSAGGDYNGDGNSDILLWNPNYPVAYLAIMDGTTLNSSSGYLSISAGWLIADAKGDYNADGNSDVLLRNTASGQVWEYQMNGTQITNGGGNGQEVKPTFDTTGWKIVSAHNDFNGDGKADILWENNTDGSAGVSLMDGMTMSAITNLGAVAGRTVQNADNDVNGDGKADILWTQTDGTVYVMEMDGVNIIGSGAIGTYSGWETLNV